MERPIINEHEGYIFDLAKISRLLHDSKILAETAENIVDKIENAEDTVYL